MNSSSLRVHQRITPAKPPEDPDRPKNDPVPIIERYNDVAAMLHKTCIAPRADRFIMACICGWAAISPIGGSARANVACQNHVLDEAEKLYERLEGQPVNAPAEE